MTAFITSVRVESFVLIWLYLLININVFCSIPTRTGVVIPVSMAATWLLAVVLVRIPATRRICLKRGNALCVLCWAFCAFWVALRSYDYDNETMKAWSLADSLKQFALIWSSTLALALEFMVMLSFWGNLKWKHPIMTVWCLVFGALDPELYGPVPNEDDLDLMELSPLLYEDPDLSHFSDSELDEKPFKLEV